MRRTCSRWLLSASLFATLTACQTVPLVPGADKVRITNTPSDVANCKALGNLPPGGAFGDENAWAVIRNNTIGLGGNTVLMAPGVAIAYQCP